MFLLNDMLQLFKEILILQVMIHNLNGSGFKTVCGSRLTVQLAAINLVMKRYVYLEISIRWRGAD